MAYKGVLRMGGGYHKNSRSPTYSVPLANYCLIVKPCRYDLIGGSHCVCDSKDTWFYITLNLAFYRRVLFNLLKQLGAICTNTNSLAPD